MSTYKISFEQIRLSTEVGVILDALERGFAKYSIDYYLVGALARDIWIGGINHIKLGRTTGDIDFAVLINNEDVYQSLKEYLVEVEGFVSSKENAFVVIWKDKTQIDLMPFGAIEDERGRVKIEGSGFTTIDVPGFNEVFENGLPEMQLESKYNFKFCSLPGIFLLKLIAWDDRPEKREKDIQDISQLLNHCFEMLQEEIFEEHNKLFQNKELSLTEIGAIVIGRKIRLLANRGTYVYERIEAILNNNTESVDTSIMAIKMTQYFQNTAEENLSLLRHLKTGFVE